MSCGQTGVWAQLGDCASLSDLWESSLALDWARMLCGFSCLDAETEPRAGLAPSLSQSWNTCFFLIGEFGESKAEASS